MYDYLKFLSESYARTSKKYTYTSKNTHFVYFLWCVLFIIFSKVFA